MKGLSKTLYIPIEIFDRELGGAILLAAEAASRGWHVVFGGKQAIFKNISKFQYSPGVFFLKSIVPGEVFKQNEILSYGHRIVSLDVEGLVPSNGEPGVRLRYSLDSISRTDLVFFWGKQHYEEVFKIYPEIKHKAHITGSPIIDELRLQRKKRNYSNLKKKILIGTSCGYANHINGVEFSIAMTKNAYSNNLSPDHISALESEAELDILIFEWWKHIIPVISNNFLDCEIVLRPHPSENKDFWNKFIESSKLENVRINYGNSVLTELYDTDVYLHFNSTTAIFSSILNIPTIMPIFKLHDKLEERITFVKKISIVTKSVHELIDVIKENLNYSRPIESINPFLCDHCENLREGQKFAYVSIMDVIESRYSFTSSSFGVRRLRPKESLLIIFREVRFFLLWALAILFNHLLGIKIKKLPPINAYKSSKAKQPCLSYKKLDRMIIDLLKKSGHPDLNFSKIKRNIFLFQP